MAWAKVDDQWFAHRKVVGLSLCARGLWTTVLSWSCAQKTPHVPFHMARFLAGGEDVTTPAKELVEAGLWHEDEDGWLFHDWSDYQERSLSEKRSEAGRKGGKASGEARREATGKQTDVASEATGEAGALPGPTRPVPTQPTTKTAPDDGFDEFWDCYPRKDGQKGGGASRKATLAAWKKLNGEQRRQALVGVANFTAYSDQPGSPFVPHATTWLNQERWEQFQEPRQVEARAGPPTAIDNVTEIDKGGRF
jgi:hypothetical protein